MASETELSDREVEILRLVATGVSNKEIAVKLAISPNTVKVHLRNVFTKVGASSRTEAALIAVRMGLVVQGEVPAEPQPEAELELAPAPVEAVAMVPVAQPLESIQVHLIEREQPAGIRARRLLLWAGMGLVVVFLLGLGGLALAQVGPFAPAPTPATTPRPTAVVSAQQPAASRWSDVSSLPAGRNGMAGAVFEGAIYVMGGETGQGVTGSVLRYRASPGGWETLADKPTAVTDVQAAVVGERIFVPGGKNSAGQPVNVLEVYSPRLNKWDQLAPLPAALSGYALAAAEGRLYLFGGWDGAAYSAAVYSYDPAANSWKIGTSLPAARSFAAAVLVENRIYVIGGYDGQQALRSLLVYFPGRDLSGDHPWEERAPLPEGRYGMGATNLANTIYLVGGISVPQKSGELPPVQYHTLDDRWNTFEMPPAPVGLRPAVLAFDTRIYVLGGLNSTKGLLSSHQTYQAIYTIVIPSIQE